MAFNNAPKFGKVELLLTSGDENNNSGCPSINKVSFEDCGLMITGDYIIVIMDEKDGKDLMARLELFCRRKTLTRKL